MHNQKWVKKINRPQKRELQIFKFLINYKFVKSDTGIVDDFIMPEKCSVFKVIDQDYEWSHTMVFAVKMIKYCSGDGFDLF